MTRRTLLPALLAMCTLLAAMSLAQAYTPPTASTTTPAMKAKVDSATKAHALAEAMLTSGMGTAETVYLWSRRWAEAARATGIATAGADHLKRMKTLEALVKTKVTAGLAAKIDEHAAAYYVAEAEVGL
jgi:hypothetical protein